MVAIGDVIGQCEDIRTRDLRCSEVKSEKSREPLLYVAACHHITMLSCTLSHDEASYV
jgi:hypothetical protein